jgi:hypothetical protein
MMRVVVVPDEHCAFRLFERTVHSQQFTGDSRSQQGE